MMPGDRVDYLLLSFLQQDCTLEPKVLSAMLHTEGENLETAACRKRLLKLKSKNCILGTVAVLDPEMFDRGWSCFMRIQVDEQKCSSEQLLEVLKADPGILEIHELFGGPDILIKVRVHYRTDALSISRALNPLVGSVETYPIATTHKETTALPLPIPTKLPISEK